LLVLLVLLPPLLVLVLVVVLVLVLVLPPLLLLAVVVLLVVVLLLLLVWRQRRQRQRPERRQPAAAMAAAARPARSGTATRERCRCIHCCHHRCRHRCSSLRRLWRRRAVGGGALRGTQGCTARSASSAAPPVGWCRARAQRRRGGASVQTRVRQVASARPDMKFMRTVRNNTRHA